MIWNVLQNLYLEGQAYFRFPWVLLFIILAFIVLIIIIKKDLFKGEVEDLNKLRFKRFMIFVSRFVVFALLIIALAQPFHYTDKITEKELMIKTVLDNTTSYGVFDKNVVNNVLDNLGNSVVVDVRHIVSSEVSPIGDQVLANLKQDSSMLLISDGNNNFGSKLDDVLALAQSQNVTVSLLDVPTVKNDASVAIQGPSKTVKDLENSYEVVIQRSGSKEKYHVQVEVDGVVVYDKQTEESSVIITKRFSEGFHKITAKIKDNDHFNENNVFYKTVKVVPRPKLLFVTQQSSPLYTLLTQIYNVTRTSSLGNYNIDKFHSVLLNKSPLLFQF